MDGLDWRGAGEVGKAAFKTVDELANGEAVGLLLVLHFAGHGLEFGKGGLGFFAVFLFGLGELVLGGDADHPVDAFEAIDFVFEVVVLDKRGVEAVDGGLQLGEVLIQVGNRSHIDVDAGRWGLDVDGGRLDVDGGSDRLLGQDDTEQEGGDGEVHVDQDGEQIAIHGLIHLSGAGRVVNDYHDAGIWRRTGQAAERIFWRTALKRKKRKMRATAAKIQGLIDRFLMTK